MINRKEDENGDYVFGTGDDFYRNEPAAVALAVWTRLKLWKGEWFLDKTAGTDWYGEVLGKRQASKRADMEIRKRILGTTGVKSILEYSSVFDGEARVFHVTATLDTIYGTAYINGEL